MKCNASKKMQEKQLYTSSGIYTHHALAKIDGIVLNVYVPYYTFP